MNLHGFLRHVGSNAASLLPFSLIVGLVLQPLAPLMRPLVWPLAVALLAIALVRTDWPRVKQLLRHPLLALVLGALNLLVVPLIMWALWSSLGLWPGLVAALCLSAMAPGIISAAATANFLKLDSSLTLLVSLVTNFTVPLTMPVLALWLLGLDLHLSVVDLSLRLVVIMAVSLAIAIVVRRLLGPQRLVSEAATLDGVAVMVLVVFAIPLMDGIIPAALAAPLKMTGFIAASFANMLLCNLVLVAIVWFFLDRKTALTAGYCSGGRHNALLMAVLPASVDPDIFLFIAAVQFPIYMIPALLQPLYRRLL
jgi:predicted Na+-dependent transporter